MRRVEVFELGNFADGEGAELAGRDIEFQGAELNAFDFFDQEADGLKHAADLAVAAFDKRDFLPGVARVFMKADIGGRRFDAAIVVHSDGNAVADTLER